MQKTILLLIIPVIFAVGCSTSDYLKNVPFFQDQEQELEPLSSAQSTGVKESKDIFVCAGDIDVAYKALGKISIGEYGFSGHDILAKKLREKARLTGAQAVINVQYDSGLTKSWKGYGELGGTDYGVKQTSWSEGTGITFIENHNALGLLYCRITKENREWFGYKSKQTGVIVVSVKPGSIAANAGVEVEDLIVEFDGSKVEGKTHFRQLMNSSLEKEVTMKMLRDGEMKEAIVFVPAQQQQPYVSSQTTRKYSSPTGSYRPRTTYDQEPPRTEQKYIPSSYKPETGFSEPVAGSSEIYNKAGDLYLRKGMYQDAIEEYKKAIDADPYNALPHFNLSIVYDKLGMKNEAAEEYRIYKNLKSQR